MQDNARDTRGPDLELPATGASGPDAPTPRAKAPFHVICKPIGALCNLRCEYCFYLEKKNLYPDREKFRMTDAVLESYVRRYIEAQPEHTAEVSFAWQGGEPTIMGVDFFRRVVELQARHVRPGMTISNALQTNGTLLDEEWGQFLKEANFLVGISIDGPPDLHDHYRVDTRGKGSSDAVIRGLQVLQRHGVEYNTLTCIQRHNAKHAKAVYRYLKEIGSRYLQFIPIVETDGQGRLTERSVGARQFGLFMCEIFDAWRRQDIGTVFVQHFDMLLGIEVGNPASLCVHAPVCGRNVAMEHNGDVFACDHFVTPTHQLGRLQQQSLAGMLDGEQAVTFGNDKYDTLPRMCLECPDLGRCYGGCPAHRIDHTPSGEPGLNHLCYGYRALYAHTRPYLRAMAACIRHGITAADYERFMPPGATSRPKRAAGGRRR